MGIAIMVENADRLSTVLDPTAPDKQDHKKGSWLSRHILDYSRPAVVENRQQASEIASTTASALAGTIAYNASRLFLPPQYRAVPELMETTGVTFAALTGGTTKYLTKSALQEVLLAKPDRNVSATDAFSGAGDGLAGLAASKVDSALSQSILTEPRRVYGKFLPDDLVAMTTKLSIDSNPGQALKYYTLRGAAGGGTFSLFDGTYKRFSNNWNDKHEDTLTALARTTDGILEDTESGALGGLALGYGGTALSRAPSLARAALAKLDFGPPKIGYTVINYSDLHSAWNKVPRLAGIIDREVADAEAEGKTSTVINGGDIAFKNVYSLWSRGGQREYDFLGSRTKTAILGNHDHDDGTLPDLLRSIGDKVPTLAANLVATGTAFEGLIKPYAVRQIRTPTGTEDVVTIGLTTERSAFAGMKFKDPVETAVELIQQLKEQGYEYFEIGTHHGIAEDIHLAQELLQRDIKVLGIYGGDSHDLTPKPVWITSETDPTKAIPIIHPGAYGAGVGRFDVVIGSNGYVDRFRSKFKLYAVDKNAPLAPDVAAAVERASKDGALDLQNAKTPVSITAPFEREGIKSGPNALASQIADSLLAEVQQVANPPSMALIEARQILLGISPTEQLSRFQIANTIRNTGVGNVEKKQLQLVDMTGEQIEKVLEEGTRKLPSAVEPSLRQKGLMTTGRVETAYTDDGSSHLIHPSKNLKYAFDRSQHAGARVSGVEVAGADGKFSPIQANKTYRVLAMRESIEYWKKCGLLGEAQGNKPEELGLSPIDLLQRNWRGRTLTPEIDGRMVDASPTPATVLPLPLVAPAAAMLINSADQVKKK
jgi:5'-nucleotidase